MTWRKYIYQLLGAIIMGIDRMLIIARKDLKEILSNFYLRMSLITFPAFITFISTLIVLTMAIYKKIPIFLYTDGQETTSNLIILSTHMILPYFLLSVSIMPVVLSTYSLIGEKNGNTIEILLSTPASDTDILFGKILPIFLLVLGIFILSFCMFTVFIDVVTMRDMGEIYLPDTFSLVVIFITGPLYAFLSTVLGLLISSRVNDIKAAQQIGSVVIVPIIGLLVFVQYSLSFQLIMMFSSILFVLDIFLFYISLMVFKREDILIRWNK